jgi:hypothetical protein
MKNAIVCTALILPLESRVTSAYSVRKRLLTDVTWEGVGDIRFGRVPDELADIWLAEEEMGR